MALSTQIGLFLAVALVYIGFVFIWAWHKGRQIDDTSTGGDS